MSAGYINLDNWQLGFAALLIVLNLAISVWLRLGLGLGRSLLVASVRMVVQLLLVGFILDSVFALTTPLPVIGIGVVMAALASVAAVRRTRRRFPGIYWNSLLSTLGAAFVVTGAALAGIINVHPWFAPQYAIPLLGMVLVAGLSVLLGMGLLYSVPLTVLANRQPLDAISESFTTCRAHPKPLLALVALPLIPFIPRWAVHRTADALLGFNDLPVSCSNLGDVDPVFLHLDGS